MSLNRRVIMSHELSEIGKTPRFDDERVNRGRADLHIAMYRAERELRKVTRLSCGQIYDLDDAAPVPPAQTRL